MPFCKECGLKLDDEAKFCPECGTPVFRTKKSTTPTQPTQESGANAETENPDLRRTVLRDNISYGALDMNNLPEGYIIEERYKIIRKIGQGGFGAVYSAYDNKLEIEKALKVIPEAVSSDKRAMQTLEREARLMIKLNHPNIVRFYDFHDSGRIKFIDMEYIAGESLSERLMKYEKNRATEKEVKEISVKVLEGLSYAHNNKVIHRDIKPQNIMITKKGEVKLMDFGIAETLRNSISRLEQTTSSGTLVYMSPEQIRGKDLGKESDIYSFGATMYEMLSGNPPFYRGDVNYQILNEKPEKIEGVSEGMNAILQKALAKDYKERYRSCEELAGVLSGSVKPKEKLNNIEKTKKESKQEEIRIKQKTEPPPIPKIVKAIKHEMILVKGGTFKMGSEGFFKPRDEKPKHTVMLDDFYIGKFQVTFEEYDRFCKKTGRSKPEDKGWGSGKRPVINVSWHDAAAYCNWLSEQEGLQEFYNINGKNVTMNWEANGYRLPTEAEWEYAARGGMHSASYKYSGGNNINGVAWYDGNSGNKTHPVGEKKPNELGIYDMSGNVWEWCNDWYGENYYSQNTRNPRYSMDNPKGPRNGTYRVRRGGGWLVNDDYCCSAHRSFYNPDGRSSILGFRIARLK